MYMKNDCGMRARGRRSGRWGRWRRRWLCCVLAKVKHACQTRECDKNRCRRQRRQQQRRRQRENLVAVIAFNEPKEQAKSGGCCGCCFLFTTQLDPTSRNFSNYSKFPIHFAKGKPFFIYPVYWFTWRSFILPYVHFLILKHTLFKKIKGSI